MGINTEYLISLQKDFLSDCKYSDEFFINTKKEPVYLLDLSCVNSVEDLFVKVREVLPLDPNLSDKEVKDENWDALNDCIGGGGYLLLDAHENFSIYVKGIECFSKINLEIWLFLDILREAFKDIKKDGRCKLIYMK